MSFSIYLVGYLILTGGLLYAAVLLHVPKPWLIVGVLVMLGVALLSAVTNTRERDRSDRP